MMFQDKDERTGAWEGRPGPAGVDSHCIFGKINPSSQRPVCTLRFVLTSVPLPSASFVLKAVAFLPVPDVIFPVLMMKTRGG